MLRRRLPTTFADEPEFSSRCSDLFTSGFCFSAAFPADGLHAKCPGGDSAAGAHSSVFGAYGSIGELFRCIDPCHKWFWICLC